MPVDTLQVSLSVWRSALLGSLLGLVASMAGWAVAREASWPPVRLMAWWVRRVVFPLLSCRDWWRRCLIIFLNNATILAGLVALGRWAVLPIVGVAGIGLSLGMALRLLGERQDGAVVLSTESPVDLRARLGIALNMLEPPAIVLAIGLSLGQRPLGLSDEQAWLTFAVWGLPMLLLAAGGEALWLGRLQPSQCEDAAENDQAGEPPSGS